MDTLTVIITALASFITALGGSSILYLRQNRRLKDMEVESRQSDEWKRLYETSDKDSREKDAKIDSLYGERQRLLAQLIAKEREASSLKVEQERLMFARCDVNECRKRRPPRRYESAPDVNDKPNDKPNDRQQKRDEEHTDKDTAAAADAGGTDGDLVPHGKGAAPDGQ